MTFAFVILLSLVFGSFSSLAAATQTVPGASGVGNASGVTDQVNPTSGQTVASIQSPCLAPSSSDLSTQTVTPSTESDSLLGSVPPLVAAGAVSSASAMPA